jgi:hypothetical protein
MPRNGLRLSRALTTAYGAFLIITRRGNCDPAYRYVIRIQSGRVINSGYGQDYQATALLAAMARSEYWSLAVANGRMVTADCWAIVATDGGIHRLISAPGCGLLRALIQSVSDSPIPADSPRRIGPAGDLNFTLLVPS